MHYTCIHQYIIEFTRTFQAINLFSSLCFASTALSTDEHSLTEPLSAQPSKGTVSNSKCVRWIQPVGTRAGILCYLCWPIDWQLLERVDAHEHLHSVCACMHVYSMLEVVAIKMNCAPRVSIM
jgi:hypothetical protein